MTSAPETKKVLVVDDEEKLVESIKTRLEGLNCRIVTAHDGVEGMIKAQLERPDLIILDINMERVDGYTMLREVRRTDYIKDTKVVMLTASGEDRDLFEAEGISDFITKPFDAEDFTLRISKVFNPDGVFGKDYTPKRRKTDKKTASGKKTVKAKTRTSKTKTSLKARKSKPARKTKKATRKVSASTSKTARGKRKK